MEGILSFLFCSHTVYCCLFYNKLSFTSSCNIIERASLNIPICLNDISKEVHKPSVNQNYSRFEGQCSAWSGKELFDRSSVC